MVGVSRCALTNDKGQMTKEIRSPNAEGPSGVPWPVRPSDFGIPSDFVIRHSGLRIAVHGRNFRTHRDHELPTVRSFGFSRFGDAQPPAAVAPKRRSGAPRRREGGTPYRLLCERAFTLIELLV